MKKLLVALCLTCALAMAVQAGEGKKKMTEEQKTLQKAMLAKYDTNKDGKMDKEERAKISAEDKEKMEKAGIAGGKKKKKE